MTISLTQKKKASIKKASICQEVLHKEFLVIRKIARLLGKFKSSFPAVRFENGHFMVDK